MVQQNATKMAMVLQRSPTETHEKGVWKKSLPDIGDPNTSYLETTVPASGIKSCWKMDLDKMSHLPTSSCKSKQIFWNFNQRLPNRLKVWHSDSVAPNRIWNSRPPDSLASFSENWANQGIFGSGNSKSNSSSPRTPLSGWNHVRAQSNLGVVAGLLKIFPSSSDNPQVSQLRDIYVFAAKPLLNVKIWNISDIKRVQKPVEILFKHVDSTPWENRSLVWKTIYEKNLTGNRDVRMPCMRPLDLRSPRPQPEVYSNFTALFVTATFRYIQAKQRSRAVKSGFRVLSKTRGFLTALSDQDFLFILRRLWFIWCMNKYLT